MRNHKLSDNSRHYPNSLKYYALPSEVNVLIDREKYCLDLSLQKMIWEHRFYIIKTEMSHKR
jgi:hypothetical protein